MKNKSKLSPLHAKWHRRVEGQIRGCINAHPEWFQGDKETIINSLAKRIVGEIVADGQLATKQSGGDLQLPSLDVNLW